MSKTVAAWAQEAYDVRLKELGEPRPLVQYVVGESCDAPVETLAPLRVGDRSIGWQECLLFIVRPFTLPLPAGLGPEIVRMCDRLGADVRDVIVQVGTRGEWEGHNHPLPNGWVEAMYDGVLAIQPRAVILDNSAERGTKFSKNRCYIQRRATMFGVPIIRESNLRVHDSCYGRRFGDGFKAYLSTYVDRMARDEFGDYCVVGVPDDGVAIINAVWREKQDPDSCVAFEAASIVLAEQGASVVIPHHQVGQRWEPLRQAYERRQAALAAATT